jgi:hypothetical protein
VHRPYLLQNGQSSDSPGTLGALIPLLLSLPSVPTVEYLSTAMGSSVISLADYIYSFPDIIMENQGFLTLQTSSLATLVNLAFRTHYAYSSNSPELAGDLPPVLSETDAAKNVHSIESICNLLKLSYSMSSIPEPSNTSDVQPHQIRESITALLILLLSAISTSPLRLPNGAAPTLIGIITELTQQYPLSPESKQAFDSWIVSFSLSSGAIGLGEGFETVLAPGVGSYLATTVETKDGETSTGRKLRAEEEDLVASSSVLRSLVS